MPLDQREQNPDVNSYNPDVEPAEEPGSSDGSDDGSTDIERGTDAGRVPLPPDVEPAAPIEEPPDTEGAPMGDVDDSPKRIA